MDQHIEDFFSTSGQDAPKGNFHDVVPLHARPELTWDKAKKLAPTLPRGWYELAQLSAEDRIEFTHEFWLATLPYHPKLTDGLSPFFGLLDVIGIFLTQQSFDDPFLPTFVYSLKDNRGFFCGYPPATDGDIIAMQEAFREEIFPEDYLSFMRIHNGFRKATDCTGIIPVTQLSSSYQKFQQLVLDHEELPKTGEGAMVDPKALIPFYESFGMPFFQCFWSGWHPDQDMGNVYYSGMTNSISEVEDVILGSNCMTFPTFVDWLLFYLEQIE